MASTYCTFGAGSIIYDETPLTTHGIIEQGACDYNDYTDITVVGATAALYTIVGANTRVRTRSGKFTGLGAITPLNTLDIDGGLTVRTQALTVAAGANNNLALPAKAGNLYVTGVGGAYAITGIAGGHDGREITIMNYEGAAMTITYNSGASSAGNRIFIGGSADLVISTFGAVTLTWFTSTNGWVVTGHKA